MSGSRIFVSRDGQEHGPMTAEEFEERFRRLEFKALDLAWREGLPKWVPVSTLVYQVQQERRQGGAPAAAPSAPAPVAEPAATAATTPAPAEAAVPAAAQARAEEQQKRRAQIQERIDRMQVLPAGALPSGARVLGPALIVLGNKGMFSEGLTRLIEKHRRLMQERASLELSGKAPLSSLRRLGVNLSPAMTGAPLLEAGFAIALEELKEKAGQAGADALADVRHSIQFDTTGFAGFVLELSATLIRLSAPLAVDPAAGVARAAEALAAARESVAAAKEGAASAPHEATAALERARAELEKQQAALETARVELQERQRFLEDSETKLFEKFQEQQLREAELDQREEVLNKALKERGLPGGPSAPLSPR